MVVLSDTYMYLDVGNRPMGGRAVVTSATFGQSFSSCVLKFSYYMHGNDVGSIQINLTSSNSKQTELFFTNGK